MRASFTLGLVSVLAGALVVGCSSGSAPGAGGGSAGPIKFGASNPQSGPAAAVCAPVTAATQKWFDHVNATGGVHGQMVDYEVLDDALDPGRATANVRKIEQDGAVAVVGGCGTAPAGAIAQYLGNRPLPYIGPEAAADSLVVPLKPSVFGVLPLYAQQIAGLIPTAFGQRGPGSVLTVTFTKSDLYDKMVPAAVTANGGTVLPTISFQTGQPSFTSEILKIRQADPDYIALVGSSTDDARLFQAMKEQGYRPKKLVLGAHTMTDTAFLNNAGSTADDLVLAAGVTVLSDDPQAKDCETALGAAPGSLSQAQLYGCAVGEIATEAAGQLNGNVTADGLMKLLAGNFSTHVSGLPGTIASSPDHLLAHDLNVVQIQGGKFVKTGSFTAPALPTG